MDGKPTIVESESKTGTYTTNNFLDILEGFRNLEAFRNSSANEARETILESSTEEERPDAEKSKQKFLDSVREKMPVDNTTKKTTSSKTRGNGFYSHLPNNAVLDLDSGEIEFR